jgi:Hypoxia induced protein conserved region
MAAMAKNKHDPPVVITGNEARAGVTGHHVRYVLAFGLAGSIVAFVVIELYFYYSKLTQTISETSTRIDATALVSYAIPFALAAVAAALLFGLWNMVISGGSPSTSQKLMRLRVALQFLALCLVMAALYLSSTD